MAESKDAVRTVALSSDSKERWAKHAITKLSKGYKLVISKTRISANFFKEGSGYETCPHKTAVKLVKNGFLDEVGENEQGVVYTLKEEFVEKSSAKKKKAKPAKEKVEEPDEDLDILDTEDLDDEIADELDDEIDDDEIDDEEDPDKLDDDD